MALPCTGLNTHTHKHTEKHTQGPRTDCPVNSSWTSDSENTAVTIIGLRKGGVKEGKTEEGRRAREKMKE